MKSSNFYQVFCLILLWASSSSFLLSKDRFLKGGSRLEVAKYDPEKFIEVRAKKPLGLTLYEIEENAKSGVLIGEIDKTSPLSKMKEITLGLYLLKINGKDVKSEDFDTIINEIVAAPTENEI
eukprot:gene22677-27630_t